MTRREYNNKSTAIKFNSTTNFLWKQDEFLENASNKERLIALPKELEKEGCPTIICKWDADLVLAETTITPARIVTAIGEDTEAVVLLLHHSQDPNIKLYFRSDKESKKNKIPSTFACVQKYLERAYVTLSFSFMHIPDAMLYQSDFEDDKTCCL